MQDSIARSRLFLLWVGTTLVSAVACTSSATQHNPGYCRPDGPAPPESDACLCPPYDLQGPPQSIVGDTPAISWVRSFGGEGEDFAPDLVPLSDGGLLLGGADGLERVGTDGVPLWRTPVEGRAWQVTAAPGGDALVVFEHVGNDPLVVLGSVELTVTARLATIVARIDAETGAFVEAFELTQAEGELWAGFEADETGFFVFRANRDGGDVYKHDFSGNVLWHAEHELGSYQSQRNEQGGVVLAGADTNHLVVRFLNVDRNDTATYDLPGTEEYSDPRIRVTALDVSPDGEVAVGVELVETEPGVGQDLGPMFLVVRFDSDAELLSALPIPARAEGLAFTDEDELVLWRRAAADEPEGRYLAQLSKVGPERRWELWVPTRSFQLPSPPVLQGRLAAQDGAMFVSGPYSGSLDLGAKRLESLGCTDHFVASLGGDPLSAVSSTSPSSVAAK